MASSAALSLLVSSLLVWCHPTGQAQAFSYSYPNDPSSDILLLGDAVERQGAVELTKAAYSEDVSSKSAGRALCRTPVRMLDPRTGHSASFTSSFSFQMFTVNRTYHGDGLAFLIAPDNVTLGGYGEQLGAFASSSGAGTDQHTFAIEFDTLQNADIPDPNDNHVGLDVANVSSLFYNNASNVGVQLNDGSIITAWIKYDGALHNLRVKMSTDSVEPLQSLIDVNISFAAIFNEFMYVGFSASTGQSSYEAHSLLAWTFSSWGLEEQSSRARLHAPKDKYRETVVLTVCLLLTLAILCFGLLSWWMASNKRSGLSYFHRARDYDHQSKLAVCASGPRPFSYRELYAATNGFSAKVRLPRGHTSVGSSFFKGVLLDTGLVVAVKQVARDPQEGLQEFLQEVSILSNMHHRNLVQLQGWCLEKGELMLVYEFMPNDSLDKFLFEDSPHEPLSWAQRYDIVSGIAGGLKYLHEGTEERMSNHSSGHGPGRSSQPLTKSRPHVVFHRDVKCSNVMLDNNFNARLGDYGLGRLVCRHRKRGLEVLKGTFGYVAPEVVENGKMSAMADVYSFGVVALEVACGKAQLDGDQVLSDMVWALERQGKVLEAADKRLKGCFDVKEMECLLHLGLLCSLADPLQRPTIAHVLGILQGESPLPPLPISPRPSRPLYSSSNPEDIQESLRISIDKLLSS